MRYRVSIGIFLCAAVLLPSLMVVADDYDEPATLVSYRQALKGSPIDRQPSHGKDTSLRMTLDDCLKYALGSNRKIRSGDYGVSAAEAQEEETHALGLPVFDYEYVTAPVPNDATRAVQTFFTGQWAWEHRVKLAMGVPVYTFGKLMTAGDLATQGVAGARQKRVVDEVQVVSRVRQLYYGIQMAEEVASLLNDAINRLSTEIKKAEAQSDDGDLKASEKYSPVEKLRMKVFRADLEKRLADVRMREEVAVNALKIQMGLPMTANVHPALGLHPVVVSMGDYDDYLSRMHGERPEVKLADIGVEAKRLEHKLAQKQWYPDVGVGGFFEIARTIGNVKNEQTTNDYVNPFTYTRAGFGLRLSGKLDIHSVMAKVDRTEAEMFKASLERDMAKEGMSLEVKEAYLRVKQSREQMQRAEETKKLARQMVFLSKSNLDLGIGERAEYIDALQTTLLTRSQFLEAVFNYNVSVAQLDEKTGYVPFGLRPAHVETGRGSDAIKEIKYAHPQK